jgi:hypothetical protein
MHCIGMPRPKRFYERLGWRIDTDIARGDDFRIVQVTPQGSACSFAFGTGVTDAAPGSARTLELIVSDIDAARDDLLARGVERVDLFHGSPWTRISGPDLERQSYRTYGSFTDPDGNEWVLQEVTRGCQAVSTPDSRRSAPRATWRRPSGVPTPPR